MRRILLATLVIGLVAGGYWRFRSRGGSSKAAQPPGPVGSGDTERGAQDTYPGSPGGPMGAPSVPAPIRMRAQGTSERGSVTPVAAQDSIAESYEKEERNPDLAAAHSDLVRTTVEELTELENGTGHIAELDCRAHHCKLQLSGDDSSGLVKLSEALQDERGFYGKAESIMLSRQGDDIVFYLRFSPPK